MSWVLFPRARKFRERYKAMKSGGLNTSIEAAWNKRTQVEGKARLSLEAHRLFTPPSGHLGPASATDLIVWHMKVWDADMRTAEAVGRLNETLGRENRLKCDIEYLEGRIAEMSSLLAMKSQ